MHDEIEKFTLEGIIGDEADVPHNKENMIHWVETDMRDQGYVPVIDIDPQYTHRFDHENDYFIFELTLYGIHVGSEEAWKLSGVMNGKKIYKPTPNPKSKES